MLKKLISKKVSPLFLMLTLLSFGYANKTFAKKRWSSNVFKKNRKTPQENSSEKYSTITIPSEGCSLDEKTKKLNDAIREYNDKWSTRTDEYENGEEAIQVPEWSILEQRLRKLGIINHFLSNQGRELKYHLAGKKVTGNEIAETVHEAVNDYFESLPQNCKRLTSFDREAIIDACIDREWERNEAKETICSRIRSLADEDPRKVRNQDIHSAKGVIIRADSCDTRDPIHNATCDYFDAISKRGFYSTSCHAAQNSMLGKLYEGVEYTYHLFENYLEQERKRQEV